MVTSAVASLSVLYSRAQGNGKSIAVLSASRESSKEKGDSVNVDVFWVPGAAGCFPMKTVLSD